jgi:hypothetical protein
VDLLTEAKRGLASPLFANLPLCDKIDFIFAVKDRPISPMGQRRRGREQHNRLVKESRPPGLVSDVERNHVSPLFWFRAPDVISRPVSPCEPRRFRTAWGKLAKVASRADRVASMAPPTISS